MASHVYSFLDVVAAIAGPGGAIPLASGAGNSDEGIRIQRTGERNTMQIGADGSGQHSLNADRSGTISVTLLATSPVNAALMAMYNFQTSSAANHGQNTITITDKNRNDVHTCQQVAFAKAPDIQKGREAGTYEWVFHAVRIDDALGV